MILLGVTGSIAAYKAVEILRLFVKAGQDVHVVMTVTATRFVGPLTFQGLSGHPVYSDVLDPQAYQMVPPPAGERLIKPGGAGGGMAHLRSEERRVGKECR